MSNRRWSLQFACPAAGCRDPGTADRTRTGDTGGKTAMGVWSVHGHLSAQLARLCASLDIDATAPQELLQDLLGPVAGRPLADGPAWPSGVADDHTPLEYSIAYNAAEPPALRLLAESMGTPPGPLANLAAAHRFLRTRAERAELSAARLDRVRDLFATRHPQ